MNVISRHCKTLVTAARPLPLILNKPELLKLWLLKPAKARLILFTSVFIYLVLASHLSQAIVDVWHPLDQDSFETGVKEFFNSPLLRKLQDLRDTRYWQLLSFFWIIGLSITMIANLS